MAKEKKTRAANAQSDAAQEAAAIGDVADNAEVDDRSPGWDPKEVARIAREHYGSLEQMFKHHDWPERGENMMPFVLRHVKSHYGSVEEFVRQHTSDEQSETAAENLSALSPQELIEKLQQAQTDNAKSRDDLLRARAEVENIRRRSQNEIVAARKFAIEGFARELLNVRDNLERAFAVELAEDSAAPVAQMKEGIGLTLKQFDLALSRFAVAEVEAAPGVRFDPECHQAISTAESADVETGCIVSVVQKGFLLKERLLRPAMVVVAKTPGE